MSEWQTLAAFLDPADKRRSFLDIATGGGSGEALLTITSAVKDAHSPPERPIHDRVRLTLDMDKGFAPIRVSHDWCYLKDGAMGDSPQDKTLIIEWFGYREHEPGLWVADGLLVNTYCELAFPRDGAFQPERDAAGNVVMLAGSAAIDMSSTSIRRYHIKTTTLTNSNVRVNSELPADLCNDSWPADTIIEDRNTGRLSGAVQMVAGGGPVMEIEPKPDRRSVVGSAFLITNVAALICFGLWLWVRRSRSLMNGRADNGRD